MSQHQNPHDPLTFLQQQTSLADDNAISNSKPFSIREYVLASRQKDIFLSWPFPEKYLHRFLDNGIKTVLPPFEPHHLAVQSLSGNVKRVNRSKQSKPNVTRCDSEVRHCSSSIINEEDISKVGGDLSESDETRSEICSQDCHLLLNLSAANSYEEDRNGCCFTGHPCKEVDSKRSITAKRKEKSIVELLEKRCTSQNLQRLTRSCYGLRRREPRELTKNGKCKSELTAAECEGAAINVLSTKKWVLKFKFRGRDSRNSRNRTLTRKEIRLLQRRK